MEQNVSAVSSNMDFFGLSEARALRPRLKPALASTRKKKGVFYGEEEERTASGPDHVQYL